MIKTLKNRIANLKSSNNNDTDPVESYDFPVPIRGMEWDPSNIMRESPNNIYPCSCYNADREVEDTSDHVYKIEECSTSVFSEILSILAANKMDITKISLPIFVLETKSLLETFADCMSHPNLFLKICNAPDEKHRCLFMTIWYLTTFHAGNKDKSAKKPFNSVIGETFHCSWRIPEEEFSTSEESIYQSQSKNSEEIRIGFMAEQLSHHPPITGLYFSCPKKRVKMSAIIQTVPKFISGSVCAKFDGEVTMKLHLADGKVEEYTFSLPTVHAKSLLTVPFVELEGKIDIVAKHSNFSGNITFETKSMRQRTIHKITGKIADNTTKDPEFIKISGTWNNVLEFDCPTLNLKYNIDVTKLKVHNKWLPPLDEQKPHESRKVWQELTDAIQNNRVDDAASLKRKIEDQQRASENKRKEYNIIFPAQHFKLNSLGQWEMKKGQEEATPNFKI